MDDASARRAFQRDPSRRDSFPQDSFPQDAVQRGPSARRADPAAAAWGPESWEAPRDQRAGAWGAGSERGGDRAERGGEAFDQRLERWVSRGRELVDGVAGNRPGSRPLERRGGAAPRRSPPASQGNGGLGAGGLNPARLGRWVEDRLDWLLDEDREDDWREPWQERPERPVRALREEMPDRPAPSGAGPVSAGRPLRPVPAVPSGRSAPEASGASARPAVARRSLEAISRRAAQAAPPDRTGAVLRSGPAPQQPAGEVADDWPDASSFSVPRWSRPSPGSAAAAARSAASAASGAAGMAGGRLRSDDPGPAAAGPPAGGRSLPRSTRRR